MAMKNCKECKHEISEKAKTCPNCGAPIPKESGVLKLIIIVVFGLFILSLIQGPEVSRNTQVKIGSQEHALLAYNMMEDFVKKQLKSPGTAKFPSTFEKRDHIQHLGGGKYRINSWVESQNSFGAKIRSNFEGDLLQTEQHEWRLISLKFK